MSIQKKESSSAKLKNIHFSLGSLQRLLSVNMKVSNQILPKSRGSQEITIDRDKDMNQNRTNRNTNPKPQSTLQEKNPNLKPKDNTLPLVLQTLWIFQEKIGQRLWLHLDFSQTLKRLISSRRAYSVN